MNKILKKKAIILDLDGVVVDSPKQKLPGKRLIKAIDSLKKEYYISVATGRVWSFAKEILKALNLKDPCIISGGTQICNPATNKILWQKNIDKKALIKVIRFLENFPNFKLLSNDIKEEDYFYGGVSPKDFLIKEPIYMLNQVFVPNNTAKKICRELNKIKNIACVLATAQKPNCKDLHILNKRATKKQAVEKLLKIIRVKKEDTIAIGDGLNDTDLFKAVSYKVAMANAVPELKNIADKVIGDVKKDGLAKYFEILNNSGNNFKRAKKTGRQAVYFL
jgi:5-amino-6-(5-phospho-D-ribitylamino)uracil phosphatase